MESDDCRTLWCGNLSEKVTEDILYELFLQGGPVEKVNIPKDRNGKQRSFAFVTYKHKISVPYALELFEGTTLYNRIICLQTRNAEQIPPEPQPQAMDINQMIQMGQQMLLGNCMQPFAANMYNMYPPDRLMTPNQPAHFSQNGERRQTRSHPYHRDRNHSNSDRDDRHNNRSNNDRDDHYSRSHRNKRSSHNNRYNDNNRRNYR